MKITEDMIMSSTNLSEFTNLIRSYGCKACSLGDEAWVLGEHEKPIPNDYGTDTSFSNSQVDIVFIGDSLDSGEGKNGYPFSNKPGQFFRSAIEDTLESNSIEDISYMFVNLVMCCAEDGSAPNESQVKTCKPFLLKQLALANPNTIVLLGSNATKYMLNLPKTIKMRNYIGKEFAIKVPGKFQSIPSIVAYHPSYAYRKLKNNILPKDIEDHYIDVVSRSIKLARRYKLEKR